MRVLYPVLLEFRHGFCGGGGGGGGGPEKKKNSPRSKGRTTGPQMISVPQMIPKLDRKWSQKNVSVCPCLLTTQVVSTDREKY